MNLLPFVTVGAAAAKRTLFWRSGGYEAVRDGDRKLQVSRHPPHLALRPGTRSDRADGSVRRASDEVQLLEAKLADHDRQLANLCAALLEEPIRIDFPADAP
jgi:hypothetical protein